MAVEGPVIVRREARLAVELAGQEAGGQRDADDHTDVAQAGLLEEELGRSLPEDVEDDLHGRDARVLDCLQRLLDLLDADAVRADDAFRHEPVAGFEHLGRVVGLPRRTVELDEIDRLDAQVLARTVEPGAQVLVRVVLDLERHPPAELRRHDERLAALLQERRDQPLGTAVAVDVGRVEERDAGVDSGSHRRQRRGVVGLAPAAADRPGAEPDLGHLAPRLA